MTRVWSVERMIAERRIARQMARSWFRVDILRRDISPIARMNFEGELIVDMYAVTGTKLTARDKCPQWARQRFDGLRDYPEREYSGLNADRNRKDDALDCVVASILRRRGYNGYIQSELPF